jgi:hypothetical protein
MLVMDYVLTSLHASKALALAILHLEKIPGIASETHIVSLAKSIRAMSECFYNVHQNITVDYDSNEDDEDKENRVLES